jgi:hypothetical protein
VFTRLIDYMKAGRSFRWRKSKLGDRERTFPSVEGMFNPSACDTDDGSTDGSDGPESGINDDDGALVQLDQAGDSQGRQRAESYIQAMAPSENCSERKFLATGSEETAAVLASCSGRPTTFTEGAVVGVGAEIGCQGKGDVVLGRRMEGATLFPGRLCTFEDGYIYSAAAN